ncbi:MAG: dockerin type I repeat-containing protein [candidate division Zixibacteria bacterium]|nr:dockerin type I repeat-containing protein [candidate division Zixibacteria bacterium]
MKKTLIVFFFSGLMLFSNFLPCFAQDPGEPDTIRFLDWGYYVVCPPCTGRAVVPMYLVNDESLYYMNIPLKWSGPIDMDTAIVVGERSEFMPHKVIGVDHTNQIVLFELANVGGGEFIPPDQGILIKLYFIIQDTGFVDIDTTIHVTTYYHFMDLYETTFQPLFYPTEFYIGEQNIPPGDVNQDGDATVSDVVYLINYLFKGGPEPAHLPSGDVNLDCDVTVSDVIYFINFLFKSGKSLELGCCYYK